MQDNKMTRHKMVRWYNPLLLIRTGIRAGFSTAMGRIADTREVQTADDTVNADNGFGSFDYTGRGDADGLWVDYVADMGDGWDSTFAVAEGLAAPKLAHEGKTLPRGDVLIMGGDEVYPDPTVTDYIERTLEPYREACRAVEPFEADLFALPGNHDWYDGLRAFSDIFYPAKRTYAANPEYSFESWTPKQERSYFALQMPGNWWLCAIDIQLDVSLDACQFDYFQGIATELMEDSDCVLLCIATPTWEDIKQKPGTNDQSLAAVTSIFEDAGAQVKLVMGGNYHHYAHYHPTGEGPHFVTAGGGGAFMHPTHKLPDNPNIHWQKGKTESYKLGAVSPPKKTSHKLSYGNLLFPFKNWDFAIVIGLLYMLMSWVLETGRQPDDNNLHEFFRHMVIDHLTIENTISNFITTVPKSPVFALLVLVTLTGLILFNWCGNWLMSSLFGVVHSTAHFFLIALIFHVSAKISYVLGMPDMHPIISYPFFMVCMFAIGGVLGGVLFGIFMIIALNIFGVLSNNTFSPLRIADHKNFVRLHFGADGRLTVYPFKIDKVGKNRTPPDAIEPAFVIE